MGLGAQFLLDSLPSTLDKLGGLVCEQNQPLSGLRHTQLTRTDDSPLDMIIESLQAFDKFTK
jgi:hypothetical protein